MKFNVIWFQLYNFNYIIIAHIGLAIASQIASVIYSTGLSACKILCSILKFSSINGRVWFQAAYLFLTIVYSSSGASINLDEVVSSLGGLISKLYNVPVYGSILLFPSLLVDSSSACSNTVTRDGLIRMALSKLIYALVSGKPSSTQPFTLQSLYLNLSSIRLLQISSGTGSPFFVHSKIIFPFSGLFWISCFKSWRIETSTRPKYYATSEHCVLLPEPGGPTITTRGGLLGALLLNLS